MTEHSYHPAREFIFNLVGPKGFDGIFGMMAGGRPRMLTEDDIKKRALLHYQLPQS